MKNDPPIIGYNVTQTLNASAKQNEKTVIVNPYWYLPNITWEAEAQTFNLGITVSTNYLGGSVSTSGWPAANVYHSASHQNDYNITGVVSFSGDGGLPNPIVIN